jgi:CheY-like chemotaxis protein
MAYTVLLIDYDPRSIARVRPMLRRFGARVILARCGISGLDEFHRNLPDLTLVQDLLPGVPGLEVCRRIKETDEGARRPVVLLCGGQSHSSLVATGCDAYIEKPYPDEEILGVLAQLLPGAPVNINPGDLLRAAEHSKKTTGATWESPLAPVPGSIEAEIFDRIDSVFDSLECSGAAVGVPPRRYESRFGPEGLDRQEKRSREDTRAYLPRTSPTVVQGR